MMPSQTVSEREALELRSLEEQAQHHYRRAERKREGIAFAQWFRSGTNRAGRAADECWDAWCAQVREERARREAAEVALRSSELREWLTRELAETEALARKARELGNGGDALYYDGQVFTLRLITARLKTTEATEDTHGERRGAAPEETRDGAQQHKQ